MKKLILIIVSLAVTLAIALTLVSCSSDTSDAASTGEETSSQTVQTVIPGQEDRAVLDDYKSITPSGEHDVKILFINVGKADCILVQIDEVNCLIDTGTDESVPYSFAALNEMGVESIDKLFLTHSDNDHVGGCRDIAEFFPVKEYYIPAISSEFGKMKNITGEENLTIVDPGSAIEITDGVWFEIYGPIKYNPIDNNNNSFVIRLEVNGRTVLFMGDALYDEEKSLMREGFDLSCDILKVGYHGRKDATSTSLMQEAMPKYAIISTSKTADKSSAHKSVVNALEDLDAKVFVTENFDLGVLFEILPDGTAKHDELKSEKPTKGLEFVSVSKETQIVTIENTSDKDIDISRWFIVSETGGEVFVFPDGTVAKAGETFTVGANSAPGEQDYKWSDSKVWNANKDDLAIIVDCYGNRIDEMYSE